MNTDAARKVWFQKLDFNCFSTKKKVKRIRNFEIINFPKDKTNLLEKNKESSLLQEKLRHLFFQMNVSSQLWNGSFKKIKSF